MRILLVGHVEFYSLPIVEIEESSPENTQTHLSHKPVVKSNVVQGEQVPAERLFRFDEMMKVRARVVGASQAVARGIKFLLRELVHRAPHLEFSKTREGNSSASILIREDAVEHVDPAVNRFEDIAGSSDSHEIARKIHWEHRGGNFCEVFPFRFRFTDCKTADRQTVEAFAIDSKIDQDVCTFFSEVFMTGTLNNSEHGL